MSAIRFGIAIDATAVQNTHFLENALFTKALKIMAGIQFCWAVQVILGLDLMKALQPAPCLIVQLDLGFVVKLFPQ